MGVPSSLPATALVRCRTCSEKTLPPAGRTALAGWQSTACHGRFSRRPCGHLCGTHVRRVQTVPAAFGRGASPTPLLPGQERNPHAPVARWPRDDLRPAAPKVGWTVRLDGAGDEPARAGSQRVSGPARWNREGGRIYYVTRDDTMMTRGRPHCSSTHGRCARAAVQIATNRHLQDVSRDGRFLLLVPQVRAGQHPITVWTAAIASTRR